MTATDPRPRRTRDPQEKQRRILDAALEEFSAHGLAGARVDAIAERSGVNKQLIYHYFRSKEGLFEALLGEMTRRTRESGERAPADWGERLARFFQTVHHDVAFTRLMAWEGLERPDGEVIEHDARAQGFLDIVRLFEEDQTQGRLPAHLDARQWLLSVVGLSAFARAYPQFTRLITGMSPDDPAFVAARAAHLQALGHLVQVAAKDAKEGQP